MTCDERKSTALGGYTAPAPSTAIKRHKPRYSRHGTRNAKGGVGENAYDGYLRRFRRAAQNVVWAYGEERDSALTSMTVAIAERFVALHLGSSPAGARRVPKYAEEWSVVFIYIALWRLRRAEPIMAITNRVLGAQRHGFSDNRDWAAVKGSVMRRIRASMRTRLVPSRDISPCGLPWATLIVPDMTRSIAETLGVKPNCTRLCVTFARTASTQLDKSTSTVTSDTRKNAGEWAASVVYTVLMAVRELSLNPTIEESSRRKRRPTTDRYNTVVRKAVANTIAGDPGRLNGHMFTVMRNQTSALSEAREMPSHPITNPILAPPGGLRYRTTFFDPRAKARGSALIPTAAPATPMI